MTKVEAATKGFFKLCLTTLVAVYFLIAVGGIVRATGSGMGCPDWPKCFGQWVPPTSVEQLPENYKESYAALREKKNQKFIKYLKTFGMSETADQMAADKTILVEADFNAVKTWIEYLNRLVGVIIGLLIVALFWKSIKFTSWGDNLLISLRNFLPTWMKSLINLNSQESKPVIFWLSFATLIGVIFQGWFGSIVVSTNLTTWTITVHMFIALLIVGFLIYLLFASSHHEPIVAPNGTNWILIACSLILLVQIFLGTQVREAIDRIGSLPRNSWISSLGAEFIVHRTFSWALVASHYFLIARLYKTTGAKALTSALMALILCSFLTGAGMAYFSVPAFLQPVHLLLATVCLGFQLLLLFRLNGSRVVSRAERYKKVVS
ncbi:MAG: COX15/CtaA family protein [Cyclobacteriaceae bacterium]